MSRNYSSTAADTTLSSGVSAVNTTLVVGATTGFPPVPFILAVDAGAAAQELVLVTGVGGTSLTVTRGYDSTVAATHEAGAAVSHSHAGADFRDSRDHEAATAAHGATGEVVGTTNTQTLTNKTLTAPAATGSLADFGEEWTPWSPTVTAGSGTFTTVSGSGRYAQIGPTVHWSVVITITTVGTASGGVRFTVPVTAQAANRYTGGGRVFAGGGAALQAFLNSTTTAEVFSYNNSSVIGAGVTLILSGTYEAAA